MGKQNPFEKYFFNRNESDITLIINGKHIPCHKFVLSDRSLVFQRMFCSEFKESNAKEIEIKDTSIQAFKVMLEYIYKNKFVMNDKNNYSLALEVIQLSHRFQIQSLIDLIEEKLKKMIEIKSFMDVLQTSKLLELNKLMKTLEVFVKENDFFEYYLSEILSDITLIIDGNRIPSHQFLLSMKSPVFEDMISRHTIESSDNGLQIKDVSFKGFKFILEYIYKKKFEMNIENDYNLVIEVLKLSHRFQINDLFKCMEKQLRKMITIENFLDIFQCYESYGLLINLKQFVRKNSNELIDFISFVGLSNETINSLLSLFKSQTPVMNVLNKMIAESPEKDLKQFKKSIKFKLCSVEDMRALRDLNLFTEEELIKIWDRKYEKLSNKYEILKIAYRNPKLTQYSRDRTGTSRYSLRQIASNDFQLSEDSDCSDSGLYYRSEYEDQIQSSPLKKFKHDLE